MSRAALSEYHRKRDFSVTNEPKGGAAAAHVQHLEFVIQKHGARRLHYDFRLELDGVMKSWAVTRGPSYDPEDKRLAVRTEDHPLEYNQFEGVIPAKQYGAGPVMIWDKGTWQPDEDPRSSLQKGHLRFHIDGARMHGQWHLVRMHTEEKRENWLLIKSDDEYALAGEQNAAFLDVENTSAISGRTLDEIRAAVKPAPRSAQVESAPNDKAPDALREPPPQAPPPSRKPKPAFTIEGIAITHHQREVFPGTGITKGDVAAYYARVMEFLLPFAEQRLLSLLRCPNAISGECFFQRAPMKGGSSEITGLTVTHKGSKHPYFYTDSAAGIIELVQMNALEFHAWQSRVDNINQPNQLIFDLDPAEDLPFAAVKLAAQDVRKRLSGYGLESFPRLTGGKGIHVVAPIAPRHEWATIKTFAQRLANDMQQAMPEAYVANMSKQQRKDRIFVDYLRNDYAATAIVPFSLRARADAPIALPLSWKELEKVESAHPYAYANHKNILNPQRRHLLALFFALRQELKI